MTLKNQGFEALRNLAESVNDVQVLNNLGGGNISSDISLFINNRFNTSTQTWVFADSEIVNDKFVFPVDVPFTFTNRDEITVQGTSLGNLSPDTKYYVVGFDLEAGNRRNQVSFGLSTERDGSLVALGSIGSDVAFTRSEVVSQDNLLNIARPRIQDSAENLLGESFNLLSSSTDFDDGFADVEGNVDTFNFLRVFKYAENASTQTNVEINVEGVMGSFDPIGFNDSEGDLGADKSPGVYITDPFSDVFDITKTRAFSTDANPWAEGTGELITQSTQVNVGDVNFADGIEFAEIDDLNTESGDADTFDYKIPVIIDEVEYFVLLKS